MPEFRSALAALYAPGRRPAGCEPAVRFTEIVGWDLLQAAAWSGRGDALRQTLADQLGVDPPATPNRRVAADGIELLTVAPDRLWCLGPEPDSRLAGLPAIDPRTGCVTRLGHSHARVRIEGPGTRRLLAQEIAIDLSAPAFAADTLARTSLHHVPVVLLCIDAATDAPVFDLFLPRSFAASTFAYLLDLAAAVDHEVRPRALRDGRPADTGSAPDAT